MRDRLAYGPSALVFTAMLLLGGCGGGGGGGIASTPAPPVTSPPAPTPTPAPAPAPPPVNVRTVEYNNANLEVANAAPAYQANWSGRGVTVAVVDSGVDARNTEFAGRISTASQDLAGSRGLGDEGGHGTAVAGVLLAAKNDSDVHGVAYGATLLALRTDTPGSCAGPGDCSHADNAIARALDVAVAEGAKVANLSLGGMPANATLRAAIARATASGMVIVMSAGNESEANPSAFALIATDPIAQGQIIVAGAHGAGKTISSFSNRAGSTAEVYLTALGEEVRSFDQNGDDFLYSGTSFSAPYVAGAAALLAQAFPNLTGAQIVQLLLESADDLGTAGTDSTYGRGALNIGRAFQPRGEMSLAGSATPLNLATAGASLSPAMGDAAQTGMGAIILDGFNRAFAVDLATQVRNARPVSSLTGGLSRTFSGATLTAGGTTVAVSIADAPGGAAMRRLALTQADAIQARATAGMIASRLDPKTSVALGFGQSGASVAGQLTGHGEPAFLVSRGPGDSLGFDRTDQSAASLRRTFGKLGVTATAETGEGLLFRTNLDSRDPYFRSRYSMAGLSLDRSLGAVRLAGSLTRLDEDRTVLGARFGPLFGGGGASTWFADARADWQASDGWSLSAAARQGWTRVAAGGLMAGAPTIRSTAFSFDVVKPGLLANGDQFAMRLSQPLRVSSGGLSLRLPVAYDYGSGAAIYADQALNLAPTGRELALETSYSRLMFGGRLDANLFWRQDPGHFAAAPDDMGAALRWKVGF